MTSLKHDGYELFDAKSVIGPSLSDTALDELVREFDELPPDPFSQGLLRFRRYDRGLILPWRRSFEWIPSRKGENGAPVSEYYQGAFNPEFKDRLRTFPAFGDRLKANGLLERLIWLDFDKTFWEIREERQPIHVGIHLVKLLANEAEAEAKASPDALHRDGEKFTFAHLARCCNVDGGENIIAPPAFADMHPDDLSERVLLDRFCLNDPLQSYGVHDPSVSHYVSGVRQKRPGIPAERSIVLIDFAAMASAI